MTTIKTVNINAQDGFTTQIHEIQFFNQSFIRGDGEEINAYGANVAVQVGDVVIVMICLHGNDDEAGCSWPDNYDDWSKEDAAFQEYVESEFTAREFLECLENDNGLENNREYLKEHGFEYFK